MPMRRRQRFAPEAGGEEVAMSPLIDCVFLLLIFFLVTTMLKRKEKQIQVELPDSTASVAVESSAKGLVIGLDANGVLLVAAEAKTRDGAFVWSPIGNLSEYLQGRIDGEGAGLLERPLQINAEGETRFQDAIHALDVCKLLGFRNVSVRMRQTLPPPGQR